MWEPDMEIREHICCAGMTEPDGIIQGYGTSEEICTMIVDCGKHGLAWETTGFMSLLTHWGAWLPEALGVNHREIKTRLFLTNFTTLSSMDTHRVTLTWAFCFPQTPHPSQSSHQPCRLHFPAGAGACTPIPTFPLGQDFIFSHLWAAHFPLGTS